MITVNPDLAELKAQVESREVPPEIAFDVLAGVLLIVSDVDSDGSEMTVMLKKDVGQRTIDFDYYCGGEIFIVETLQDLDKVVGILPKDRRDNPDVTTAPITEGGYIFDIADDKDLVNYVKLCLITNNSGGNQYYVPKRLKLSCVYIQLAIKEAAC